jgi:glycosyltransferase involved in cell wall biosynthesis
VGDGGIDILMITYRRPHYTRLSLQRLLETCDDSMRVWLWHNGTDAETRAVVHELSDHANVHRVHVSDENLKLRAPTNWLWENATGDYLSKIDDDCIESPGWAQKLREAHEANPRIGQLGCWRFQEEDFVPELAERKIVDIDGGHRMLVNCWVQGSGYLMKRACVEQQGLLGPKTSFTQYGVQLARRGWVNGFYYPFLYEDHMDDPRSPNSSLRCDDDLRDHLPLSAIVSGVTTLAEWQARIRRMAREAQAASPDPRMHSGWRRRWKNLGKRLAGRARAPWRR